VPKPGQYSGNYVFVVRFKLFKPITELLPLTVGFATKLLYGLIGKYLPNSNLKAIYAGNW